MSRGHDVASAGVRRAEARAIRAAATAGGLLFCAAAAHPQLLFDGPPTHLVGSNPRAIAVADFNLDGQVDVAVAALTALSVSILLGQGEGIFTAGPPAVVGSGQVGVAVGDFDLDGKPDLVTVNNNNVSVLLGDVTAEVLYAGAAPGLITGIVQINARIPDNTPTGKTVPLTIRVENIASPPGVTLNIK